MSRLLCVGNSSKVPAQGAEKVKTGVASQAEPAVNRPAHLTKPVAPKSQPGGQTQGKCPSAISDRGQARGNSSRREVGAVLQASSRTDETTHGKEKLAKQTSPVCAVEEIGRAECVEKVHQDGPVLTVHQSLGVPVCPNTQSTSEEESEDDEDCGEDQEEAEHHAPIELLAEFLKAVMGKDYPLAKKLCQMILIYEPENPEAKHFLPLIEERMLIEEAQTSSCEDNKSDENGDDSEDGEDNDDDSDDSEGDSGDNDDDDEDSSSTDSDGEFTDSSSSASDEKEEDISQ
uniref:Glutamate rich 2 n=1 Tax=Astyanax mexicanus TaxID=7994 RepID=W5KZD7_ASTMX